MRLFVAIDLDDAAREAIGAEQQKLRKILGEAGRSSPRWARPEQMHLTLVFLGEITDAARASAIVDAMQGDIPVAPFTMVFGGVGAFPPRGAPSVLWIGVSAGASEVAEVQRRVVERLEPL